MRADWIKQYGEATLATLELFVNDVERFVGHMPERPRPNTRVQRKDDGSVLFIALEPQDFARTIEAHHGLRDYPIFLAQWALENLEKNAVAIYVNQGIQGAYTLFDNQVRPPHNTNELDGALFGYQFFLNRRKPGIVEICVRVDGDLSTGTGFFARMSDGSSRLITCRHNLFDDQNNPRDIEFMRANGEDLEIQSIIRFRRADICVIEADLPVGVTPINIREGAILDTVITAGFPRVFFDQSNPLLLHRGEVNGWVGALDDGNLFGVTSASVAPGNSGGPVLNSIGSAIGVVAQLQQVRAAGEIAHHNFFIPASQIRHEVAEEQYDEVELG